MNHTQAIYEIKCDIHALDVAPCFAGKTRLGESVDTLVAQ